jgi:hypothetical protein
MLCILEQGTQTRLQDLPKTVGPPSSSMGRPKRPPRDGPPNWPAHQTNVRRATQRGEAADQSARRTTQRCEATDQPDHWATQRDGIADQPNEAGAPTNPARLPTNQSAKQPSKTTPKKSRPSTTKLSTGHHWTVPRPWKWHQGVSVKHDDGYVYLLTRGTERSRP